MFRLLNHEFSKYDTGTKFGFVSNYDYFKCEKCGIIIFQSGNYLNPEQKYSIAHIWLKNYDLTNYINTTTTYIYKYPLSCEEIIIKNIIK